MAIPIPISGERILASWGTSVASAINDTVAASGTAVNGTGWTVDSFSAYTVLGGKLLVLGVTFTRSGANITVPANGDVGNSLVATMPASCGGTSVIHQALGTATIGRIVAVTYRPSDRALWLNAVSGTGDIATGNQFQVSGLVALT